MRRIARLIHLIPVDADSNLVRAMQAGAFGLRHGKVLVLFPEGERSIDGSVRRFKNGASILATHLRVPVVPVALDGSCNGLQHFSALLADSVGGESVNLINSPVPSDIYASVAAVLEGKLRNSDEPEAAAWLQFGIDRKLCKKPVMTLPYGSTRSSCTDSILSEIIQRDRLFFGTASWKHAQWLTKHLWSSIGEVVVAARAAMTWLRSSAGISQPVWAWSRWR